MQIQRRHDSHYYINPEIFVIPDDTHYLIHMPLDNKVVRLNAAGASQLLLIAKGNWEDVHATSIHTFEKEGIISNKPFAPPNAAGKGSGPNEFTPTAVTLFPTYQCNLRCVYCYANAGDQNLEMPFHIAKAAIDLVVSNAASNDAKHIKMGFHGGGEPFSNFHLMKDAVEYARHVTETAGLRTVISVATNGVLSAEKREWLTKNADSVTLSFDGPKDIHDQLRPLKHGGGSFDSVFNTLKFLDLRNRSYAIRSTITDANVNRMIEMVDFFSQFNGAKTLHFEPVFICGRCRQTNMCELDNVVFAEKFIQARRYAKTRGIRLRYSSADMAILRSKFCGAANGNFFVTPDGLVTACLEVMRRNDPRSEQFIYGEYGNGGFHIDNQKLERLYLRSLSNLSSCEDCFAKHHCAGDCPAKVWGPGNDFFEVKPNNRCYINRTLLRAELKGLVSKGGEYGG